MIELLPFQRTGVFYLQSARKRLLIDDPGLGKTAQAFMALPDNAAALVVAPSSLASVWLYEAERWRLDLAISIIPSIDKFRWPRQGEIVVCSWGVLPPKPPSPPAGVFLIADEVHNAKNPQAHRTRRFRDLRTIVLRNGGSVWGLTGTPLFNHPPDLWGVLDSLGMAQDVFGRYGTFIYMFRGYPTDFGMRWGQPRPEVRDLLAKYVLGRSRSQVLPDLPAKFYQTLHVSVDPDYIPPVSIDFRGRSPDLSTARAALARQKVRAAIPALKEMASREALVVFSAHRGAAEDAAQALQVPVAYGGTNVAALVKDFQSGRILHFVGTVGAAGTGFTLVRSHTVVFIERDWTPALNEQAEDRVCRIGQTKGVRIIDIVSDHPIDRRVDKVLRHKEEVEHVAVELLKEAQSKNGL